MNNGKIIIFYYLEKTNKKLFQIKTHLIKLYKKKLNFK
jgi:hypothetical protein